MSNIIFYHLLHKVNILCIDSLCYMHTPTYHKQGYSFVYNPSVVSISTGNTLRASENANASSFSLHVCRSSKHHLAIVNLIITSSKLGKMRDKHLVETSKTLQIIKPATSSLLYKSKSGNLTSLSKVNIYELKKEEDDSVIEIGRRLFDEWCTNYLLVLGFFNYHKETFK